MKQKYDDDKIREIVPLGRKYRVTDNAVRKWCDYYDIVIPKTCK